MAADVVTTRDGEEFIKFQELYEMKKRLKDMEEEEDSPFGEKEMGAVQGVLHEHDNIKDSDVGVCDRMSSAKYKKRKMNHSSDIEAFLPNLLSSGYFTEPSIDELAARELADPGYCSRVPNFVVGREGYGHIRFLGSTDVRRLDLDQIVKFSRNSVVVYENEFEKPRIGHGLNKASEVTLVLQLRLPSSQGTHFNRIIAALRKSTVRQGAHFLSFDSSRCEWKFLVHHFSRFGLADDEEEDIVMDEVVVQPAPGVEEPQVHHSGPFLSHSLPAHLGLDPVRMQEMRMLMFPVEEDEDYNGSFPSDKKLFSKDHMITGTPSSSARSSIHRHVQGSSLKTTYKTSPSIVRNAPQALLEYNVTSSDISPSRNILMTGQNKGAPVKHSKVEGFKLKSKYATLVAGEHSRNVVDAALFMGRSFRVGWGPNGILVHSGAPVGGPGNRLSSVITVEKLATDRSVRDARNKVKDELIDLCFSSPLDQHRSLDHETLEVRIDSDKIKLQKVVASRFTLSEVCRAYIGIIEKQLEVTGVATSSRVLLMHQVTVWELIKVLFSERETSGRLKPPSSDDSEEDMILDKKEESLDIDFETKPYFRRAEFSYWLQDSVCHRVLEEISYLSGSSDLQNILLLLTGRQLDTAVEQAASIGDVRLAILLSQSGGSMVNRSDMAHQLDIWRNNGLDFEYIEKDRLKLYQLLAGNIQGALPGSSVDWKRYLGMVMWYELPPDTSLPVIIRTYQQLLDAGRVPHPVPVYIDEGPFEEAADWTVGDRYDMAYYLMLLHSSEEKSFGLLNTMFSAFSSTHDPLDYHMIWHQRAILEAIGAFNSDDLHVLDMSFITQLLCIGECHWAIYVALHMPYHGGLPHIQAHLIKEILYQYCETWSTDEAQWKFIEDLGIPSKWMHGALAVYYQYYGDLSKALEHYLQCSNWHKAHSIFMTSVAHSLFLSSKYSEIWRITSFMEEHKSEIADWDLGAGIYIDFYTIKKSLEEVDMGESDPLENKNEACRNFFSRLNESLLVWGSRLPVDARATYSKMVEELCGLLASTPGESSPPSVQMGCFDTMLSAPIPEDLRSCHLQDALSVFTYLISSVSA